VRSVRVLSLFGFAKKSPSTRLSSCRWHRSIMQVGRYRFAKSQQPRLGWPDAPAYPR